MPRHVDERDARRRSRRAARTRGRTARAGRRARSGRGSRTRPSAVLGLPSGVRPLRGRKLIGCATDEFRTPAPSNPATPNDRTERRAGMTMERRTPLARTDRPLHGRPDDRARHDDRERGAAVDQGRPRLLRGLARVGRQRVPAHLRRLHAARRTARRPLRPPAAVRRRDRALHRRVARLRARRVAGTARRRARACRGSAARSWRPSRCR